MAGRRTTPRVEAAAVRRYNMAAIRRRYQRLGKVWHISIPLHPSFASVSKDARVWAEAWVGLRRASVSRRQLGLVAEGSAAIPVPSPGWEPASLGLQGPVAIFLRLQPP